MNKKFYESNVLAEHLARRYPRGGFRPRRPEIGMQALADAYNTYTESTAQADLERLIDLAKYAAATWPDREQGDDAHLNLGQIYRAAASSTRPSPSSPLSATGLPRSSRPRHRLGSAHWCQEPGARPPRPQGKQAAGGNPAAIDMLGKTLKARRDAGAGPTDPGLIGNAADLAVASDRDRQGGRRPDFARPDHPGPNHQAGRLLRAALESNLLAQITAGKVEPAIATDESPRTGRFVNRLEPSFTSSWANC